MSEGTEQVSTGNTEAAPDDTPRRGRKPGSKVKVKKGVIVVKGPRKPKVSHGWFLQMGVTTSGRTTWNTAEVPLAAKSVKTAMREAKELISKDIETAGLDKDDGFSARVFEVKYLNLNIRSIPQKPKVVL